MNYSKAALALTCLTLTSCLPDANENSIQQQEERIIREYHKEKKEEKEQKIAEEKAKSAASSKVVKWVDANGKTHFSSTAPEEYLGSSENMDVSAVNTIMAVKMPSKAELSKREMARRVAKQRKLAALKKLPKKRPAPEIIKRVPKSCDDMPSLAIQIKCRNKKTNGY